MARLSAELTPPKGAVHVVSDVHGEDVKLRHVVNNASGTLRPLVEWLFGTRMSKTELRDFLSLIFYPREMLESLEPELHDPARRQAFAQRVLQDLFTIVRALAPRYPVAHLRRLLPADYADLLREMLHDPRADRNTRARSSSPLVREGRDQHLIRLIVRLVRDLAVSELIVAGDCVRPRTPRRPRDRVPAAASPTSPFTWGNHDVAWIGACPRPGGADRARAAHLASATAGSPSSKRATASPCSRWSTWCAPSTRDDPAETLHPARARACARRATMALHAEGGGGHAVQARGPDHRPPPGVASSTTGGCCAGSNPAAGTVGDRRQGPPARATARFPTFDPAHPEALRRGADSAWTGSAASFLSSPQLWQHVKFLVERGSMWLRRDDHLIFHGCVPVDDDGEFLSDDGRRRAARGPRPLRRARARRRAQRSTRARPADLDLLWYLWSGPLAPTLRQGPHHDPRDATSWPTTRPHHETKNPYFKLIHEAAFCERVPRGVRLRSRARPDRQRPRAGQDRQGRDRRSSAAARPSPSTAPSPRPTATTATRWCWKPDRTFLGLHHHFESVDAAVREGVDIIPTIAVVRQWDPPRRVADTERGQRSGPRSACSAPGGRPIGRTRCASEKKDGPDSRKWLEVKAGLDKGGPGCLESVTSMISAIHLRSAASANGLRVDCSCWSWSWS